MDHLQPGDTFYVIYRGVIERHTCTYRTHNWVGYTRSASRYLISTHHVYTYRPFAYIALAYYNLKRSLHDLVRQLPF